MPGSLLYDPDSFYYRALSVPGLAGADPGGCRKRAIPWAFALTIVTPLASIVIGVVAVSSLARRSALCGGVARSLKRGQARKKPRRLPSGCGRLIEHPFFPPCRMAEAVFRLPAGSMTF